MSQKLLKWLVIGVVAGVWTALYGLAEHHGDQAILIIFTILGAARVCSCEKPAGEVRHG